MFGNFSGFGDLTKITNALNFDDLQADLDPSLLTPEQRAKIEADKKAKAEEEEAFRLKAEEDKKAAEEENNTNPDTNIVPEQLTEETEETEDGDDWAWDDVPSKKEQKPKIDLKEEVKEEINGTPVSTQSINQPANNSSSGFFGFVSEGSNLLKGGGFSLDSLQADSTSTNDEKQINNSSQNSNKDTNNENNNNSTVITSTREKEGLPISPVINDGSDSSMIASLRRELDEAKWMISAETEQREKFQGMVRNYAADMMKAEEKAKQYEHKVDDLKEQLSIAQQELQTGGNGNNNNNNNDDDGGSSNALIMISEPQPTIDDNPSTSSMSSPSSPLIIKS